MEEHSFLNGNADRFGKASLDCGKLFDFVGTAPYSLEIWMRADVIDATYRFVLTKDHTAPTPREEYGLVPRYKSRGTRCVRLQVFRLMVGRSR